MVKVVHLSQEGHLGSVVARVAEQMSEVIARPEMKEASHETIVKESLKSVVEKIPEVILPTLPPSTSTPPSVVSDTTSHLPSYLDKDTDPNDVGIKQHVETLVADVFSHGLDHAIALGKKQPPFIEDAFHDALVEKLIPELRQKGIL